MHPDLTKVDQILERYPREESSPCDGAAGTCSPSSVFFHAKPLKRWLRPWPSRNRECFRSPHSTGRSASTPAAARLCRSARGPLAMCAAPSSWKDEFCRQLGVPVGGTTPDNAFTIESVNCVGACAMAPVVVMGGRYHREVKPSQIERLLKRAKDAEEAKPESTSVERPTIKRCASPQELLERARLATPGCFRAKGPNQCLRRDRLPGSRFPRGVPRHSESMQRTPASHSTSNWEPVRTLESICSR